MKLLPTTILGLSLFTLLSASAQPLEPGRLFSMGFPSALSKQEFQSLLQRFVNDKYQKSFRTLGDENDFDHGHFLFSAQAPQRPVAILYHTQELTHDASMDPAARNWIQWVDGGNVENAVRYERREYPHTATWDWFIARELPALRARHTILDKMLDPALLGTDVSDSRQWVFTRVECGGAPPAPGSNLIEITLPSGPSVCLALGQS
jgi:hypothetical protein